MFLSHHHYYFIVNLCCLFDLNKDKKRYNLMFFGIGTNIINYYLVTLLFYQKNIVSGTLIQLKIM